MISSIRSISITFVTLMAWRARDKTILRTRKLHDIVTLSLVTDNSPDRCQRIITQNQPGPGDCHGCPYRHYTPENLQSALLSSYGAQGLTSADLPEIMSLVKTSHFHVACTRVFEITHASCGIKKGDGVAVVCLCRGI